MNMKLIGLVFAMTCGFASAQSSPVQPFQTCEKAEKNQFYKTTDNWIIIGNELRKEFPELKKSIPDIVRLSKVLKSQDIVLVPVIIPLRPMVESNLKSPTSQQMKDYDRKIAIAAYRDALKDLNSSGIPTVDLVNSLQNRAADVFFRNDHHITPEGAKFIAQAVSAQIKRLPSYSKLSKMDFTTSVVKSEVLNGASFSIEPFCGPQPKENFTVFETKAREESNDLLGGEDPEVVYVGTSMGRDSWNLIGELKRQLRLDINDQHVEAAGAWLSMLNYFSSKEYDSQRPKIIIWEFSLYETYMDREGALPFASSGSISQVIGAAKNTCINDKIISSAKSNGMTNNITIKGNFVNLKNGYIQIDFDNLAIEKFDIILNQGNKVIKTNLEVPNRLTNRGKAYFDLPSTLESVSEISLSLPKDVKSNISLRLCKF